MDYERNLSKCIFWMFITPNFSFFIQQIYADINNDV